VGTNILVKSAAGTWWQNVFPECWYPCTRLYNVATQKTTIWKTRLITVPIIQKWQELHKSKDSFIVVDSKVQFVEDVDMSADSKMGIIFLHSANSSLSGRMG